MARFDDKELQDALDQDLGEFDQELSRVGCVWGPEPSFPDFERKVVKSIPPVELHVGRIPLALTKTGLENIFSKFGDILKIDLIRGKGVGVGGFNFGFVTFCSRICAAEAVAMINRAPPLHLIVTYKITDKQKEERLQKDQMVEEFYHKWNGHPCPGAEELQYDEQDKIHEIEEENEEVDYDEEIRREEKMQDEVDKFFDDSDSDIELSLLHSKTSKKEKKDEMVIVKVKCKRCGKEGVSRCSVCKVERYCGEICQGLDWPQHKKVCVPSSKLGRDNPAPEEAETMRESVKGFINNLEIVSERGEQELVNGSENKTNLIVKCEKSKDGGGLDDVFKCLKKAEKFQNTSDYVSNNAADGEVSQVPLIGNVSLKVGSVMEVVVVHVESPTAVYVCSDLPELKKFQKHLFKTCSELSLDPEFIPNVGSIVLAKTKSDEYWYRARVLSCDQGKVTFFCPDFGFTDVVKLDRIRRINTRLAETYLGKRFMSCRCVLKEWRKGTDPSTYKEIMAVKRIIKVSDKVVKVEVLEKRAGYYVVDMPGVDRRVVNRVGDMEEEVAIIRKEQYAKQ